VITSSSGPDPVRSPPAGGEGQLSSRFRIALHRTWWNRYARSDPFWAVLTENEKKAGGWDVDEFFRRGEDTITRELERLKALGLSLRFDRALDFGCGLGRLTNGLAGHFAHTTGVDISPPMLRHARQFVRHPDKIDFVATADPALASLPDNSFDLVYSEITLQHIAPAEAERYIGSLVRLVRPGGVISFQVPACIPPPHPLEKFKFSSWPPTLWMRLKRYAIQSWKQALPYWRPHMPMYAIPRERVVALLEASGARLLDITPSNAAGSTIESYHYRAVKTGYQAVAP
jgi:SAM-dependent methyltransferase